MAPSNPDIPGLTSILRHVRAPVIHVECRICRRAGRFERAELVKKHGASITFARLRRIAAMGCARLAHVDGDRCGTRFPCLDPLSASQPGPVTQTCRQPVAGPARQAPIDDGAVTADL